MLLSHPTATPAADTASSERQILPDYFVVNYAHTGLRDRSDEAQLRIVGAFSTTQGAQKFCDAFTAMHQMDCFMVQRGTACLVPKNYAYFEEDGGDKRCRDKVEAVSDTYREARARERQEFKDNKARKQSYTKGAEFDEETERSEFMKLLKTREEDRLSGENFMQTELFSVSTDDSVSEKLKGSFRFAAVSTMPDTTTDNPAEQEHCFVIHNVFKSVEDAKAYIGRELNIHVQDKDIFVVDMYEWMRLSYSFSNFAMEHVPTEYRDPTQNTIMQYRMSGARRKREKIEAEHRSKIPVQDIAPQGSEEDEDAPPPPSPVPPAPEPSLTEITVE